MTFNDKTVVLLTGCTGYIGGLVLEELLRVVGKVYVTVRTKRGQEPQQRVSSLLLEHPLFASIRNQPDGAELLAKVVAVAADLAAPACGFTALVEAELKKQVNIIIHCAASLSLELHIHDALAQTYFTTKGLLHLAQGCRSMQAFCFVSTAYVNANQPRGSLIEEKIYPLSDNGAPVQQAELVAKLMGLPIDAAETETRRLLKTFGYLNTYLLSKTLTERMVMERDGKPCPVCIVRPALCGAVAKVPCPGYIGNASGATSAILAVATGLATFTGYGLDSLLPLVPGDVVAAVVVAATAAQVAASSPAEGQSIYHVCSSATFPITLREFHDHIADYFRRDPLLKQNALLVPSQPKRMLWVSDGEFRWRAMLKTVHYWLICMVLNIMGQGRLATKLMLGWNTWKNLGSSAMDHNMRYSCEGARKLLQAHYAAVERRLTHHCCSFLQG
ncbi:hypothetical protein WJX72_006750 [[Myrmecia] bisecta]|uniref:Fatty acyl-CoA reductase n=1 Tax=[Myrmecia] bisecta TaxID=41462 RepID=A0AAW1QFI1_9CHLO